MRLQVLVLIQKTYSSHIYLILYFSLQKENPLSCTINLKYQTGVTAVFFQNKFKKPRIPTLINSKTTQEFLEVHLFEQIFYILPWHSHVFHEKITYLLKNIIKRHLFLRITLYHQRPIELLISPHQWKNLTLRIL